MSDSGPPIDIEDIRETCPVFRVLIIGRANAGKTTILQKVCNVDKDTKPVVYDADGHELKDWDVPANTQVPATEGNSSAEQTQPKSSSKRSKFKNPLRRLPWMRKKHVAHSTVAHPTDSESSNRSGSDSEMSDTDILRPSTQRGRHDITNQITYPGSRFVFHDSRGIEAGSVDELRIIREFVRERASKQSLAERLHAIWFCVPMDNKRPLVHAELSFFNENTENVPVVVVFTKYDALLDDVANELGIINLTEGSKATINETAEARYEEHYHSCINKTAYPPKAVVRLQEMNKAETNCAELSEQTAVAIDDLSLRQLFVSVQQNNLNLCMQEAARVSRQQDLGKEQMVLLIWLCFPHAWTSTWFNKPERWAKGAEAVKRV